MNEKLEALRSLMKKFRIQAYLIPSSDPHQSEYAPEFWKRRQFITGFTGSSGDTVVTMTKAGLWTDSRYFLQAERELQGSGFALFKWGTPGIPSWQTWVAGELKKGEALGHDPKLLTHKNYSALNKALEEKEISLKSIEKNLVDEIWEEQPRPPEGKIEVHPKKFAGEPVESKLSRLRKKMTEEGADIHILSQLDAIAWLFNIRGRDVDFNPVVIAYAIVTKKQATVFIDPSKVTSQIRRRLKGLVNIFDYHDFSAHLKKIQKQKLSVWLDEPSVSQWIVEQLIPGAVIILKPSPVTMFKAIKNKTEIKGFREAHIRDGVSMVKFLCWLEQEVGRHDITELEAAAKAEEFRARQSLFKGMSFKTISSYGPNSAVVHYSPTPETNAHLRPKGIYLIDSGAQYLDASTDITRTISLGKSTEKQKENFTRVLKGLMALSQTSFPHGTSGKQLDTIARLSLWEKGLNYGHGTGHGVGTYLNVHEGPHSISPTRCQGIGFEPGMITSIEPGNYVAGEYGMRTENMALVVKDEERSSAEWAFYKFETLTLCPIDLKLMKKDLLTTEEICWLNDYHEKVRHALAPFLTPLESFWLTEATKPLI